MLSQSKVVPTLQQMIGKLAFGLTQTPSRMSESMDEEQKDDGSNSRAL